MVLPILAMGAGLIQWMQIGQHVISAGSGLYSQIMAVIRSSGYAGDTSALDEAIADADRRKAIAAQEKDATS
jgi:hypothetical protein